MGPNGVRNKEVPLYYILKRTSIKRNIAHKLEYALYMYFQPL